MAPFLVERTIARMEREGDKVTHRWKVDKCQYYKEKC